MKSIIWWSVAIALGLFLLGTGIATKATASGDPVQVHCGNQIMLPGEDCVQERNGKDTHYTYEDQRQSEIANAKTGPWVSMIGGGLLVLLGGFKLFRALRRRRTGPAQPMPPPQPQQWAPQYQQQVPQQQYQQPQPYQQPYQQQPQQSRNFGPQGH